MTRTPVQSAEMRSISSDQRNEPRLSAGLPIWPHQRRRVGAERTARRAAGEASGLSEELGPDLHQSAGLK